MIAIVSHDSGGAEILSSWLIQNPQPHCLVLKGPAIEVFKRKLNLKSIENHSLDDAIEKSDLVLCGTSWQADLEKNAILLSQKLGKKVISFLDHWTNYLERFMLGGALILPDELWVGDLDAQSLAQDTFPKVNVILVENPYFKDLALQLNKIKKPKKNLAVYTMLYICEPISEHALLAYGDERHWGYTEVDAILFTLTNLDALAVSVKKIIIRPHPSESQDKYDWVKEVNPLVKSTYSDMTLIEQIAEADIVVGCSSMALVVGLLAKKRVISSIPPGGNLCQLPHSKIEHLQDLVRQHKKALND